jgi:hypothetical protein
MPLIEKKKPLTHSPEDRFVRQPATLNREELEYSAQKIFTYATIGFAAIGIYAALSYLVVQQLKK